MGFCRALPASNPGFHRHRGCADRSSRGDEYSPVGCRRCAKGEQVCRGTCSVRAFPDRWKLDDLQNLFAISGTAAPDKTRTPPRRTLSNVSKLDGAPRHGFDFFVTSAKPCCGLLLGFFVRETPSPRDRYVFPAGERTCRAVRAEQRNAHYLAGALLDRLRPGISVEVCLGEAWGN